MGIFKNGKKKDAQAERPVYTWKQELVMDLRDMITVLAGFMLVYMLLFRVVVVVGPSMFDTLVDGDRLVLVSNVLYREPEQGDIIVASKESFGGECIVKRVIATEGQTVDIDFDAGIVYVDGLALNEPYAHTLTTRAEGTVFPLTVEKDHVFVLGDNRNDSKDSRDPSIGLVDHREILGKVVFLLMPGDHYGTMDRDFGRIGVMSKNAG